MMELMGLTGLSMGAVNEDLQARREKIAAEKAEEERIANLECGRVLKAYQCSWSAYLEENPSVKAWAEKYPEMAEKERIKQGALEQLLEKLLNSGLADGGWLNHLIAQQGPWLTDVSSRFMAVALSN